MTKFLSPFKEFGFLAGLLYGIDQVLYRLGSPARLYLYELMAQPIADAPVLTPRLAKGIAVREIGPGDPALAAMPVTAEALAARFAMPTVCLGAFRGANLVAYMWLCLGPYEEDEVRCLFVPQPASRAVWDFDFYVFPQDRLSLGFVCLWDAANAYLRARGYRYSCSRVSRFNIGSRSAHKHFKWDRVGHALFVRSGRFQAMLATVPPYLHVTVDQAARPTVPVRAEPTTGPGREEKSPGPPRAAARNGVSPPHSG